MLAPTMPPPMMTTWARSGICLAMDQTLEVREGRVGRGRAGAPALAVRRLID
ncbi:MAG: hypothetical protein Ct9H300mP12_04350 [Acidimicrobiales bacterium]|nr:MAG: hypothetical protein Ct9H300mP12_04350 [Acidimicrobiales bacterium]